MYISISKKLIKASRIVHAKLYASSTNPTEAGHCVICTDNSVYITRLNKHAVTGVVLRINVTSVRKLAGDNSSIVRTLPDEIDGNVIIIGDDQRLYDQMCNGFALRSGKFIRHSTKFVVVNGEVAQVDAPSENA